MTPNRRRFFNREDFVLLVSSVLLGLGGAAAFAAYRAVNASSRDTAGRLGEFAANLFWPGALIFLAVGAAVWFGWKANID